MRALARHAIFCTFFLGCAAQRVAAVRFEPPDCAQAGPDSLGRLDPFHVLGSWANGDTPWVVGRSGQAPENTFYAFDEPACAGIPIELDVWRTADGVPVVIHDRMTTRTTGITLDVTATSLAELRKLNAAANWDAAMFPATPIPTLQEVIARYGNIVPLIVEIKGDEGTAAAAVGIVRKYGVQASTIISSFGSPQLNRVKALEPSIRTMLMVDGQDGLPAANSVQAYGAWGVALKASLVTAAYVSEHHAAGLRVFAWAVDYVYEAESLIAKGVDGIYTNAPTYLRALCLADTPSGTVVEPTVLSVPGLRLYSSATPDEPGGIIDNGSATFQVTDAPEGSTDFLIYPGVRAPEGSYTVSASLSIRRASLDRANVIGIRVGFASDHDTSYVGRPATEGAASNGYLLSYAADGRAALQRVTANVPSDVAAGTWPPVSEGEAFTLRLDVTATTLTASRLDTGHVLFAVDDFNPRRGFVSIYGKGQVPALREARLTY